MKSFFFEGSANEILDRESPLFQFFTSKYIIQIKKTISFVPNWNPSFHISRSKSAMAKSKHHSFFTDWNWTKSLCSSPFSNLLFFTVPKSQHCSWVKKSEPKPSILNPNTVHRVQRVEASICPVCDKNLGEDVIRMVQSSSFPISPKLWRSRSTGHRPWRGCSREK